MFNGTTYHNIRRLGFFQVLGLGVDPCVPALGHWLAPVPTFRVFATRTGEQGSKSARCKHVDLAAFLVVVLGIRSDGHDSALKTKRDGSLAKRHVGALERVGQEVGMFCGVGIGVRKPNGDDMTLGKEAWFLESGLNGLVQRQRRGVQSRGEAGEMSSAAGDVQVVSQRDPVAGLDLQNLMLTVAVKGSPFDAGSSVGSVC
jgi:hypothetical protein